MPDERLDKLAEMYEPDKKTPAVIEFVDIAGLVKGASQGAGLGNKFLANIRETDAIVHVVRCLMMRTSCTWWLTPVPTCRWTPRGILRPSTWS